MSQDDRSAKKKSYNVTVTQLEGQTCHPPNPHFGWRPFWPVGFVCKVNMYLRDMLFWFPPNPHFGWWLFLTVGFVWKVIMHLRVKGFSNFVPILISAGGHFDQLDLFTEWSCICSRGLSYFLLIFTWQECRYASKTTNLKQLHQSSPFDFKVWQIFRRGSFSLDSFPVVHCSSIRDVFLKRTSNLFVWLVYPLGSWSSLTPTRQRPRGSRLLWSPRYVTAMSQWTHLSKASGN